MLNLQTVLRGFEENGLKQETLYRAEEILAKLDQMGKKEFDREIGDQIFQQCRPTQLNLKSVFRLADVGQTLVDGCLILTEKIKKAEQQLKIYQTNKTICENQLAETSVYSDTRYLFMTLLSAKNIPLKLKYTNCHVQLTLGVTNQLAKPVQSYDRVNPEFNQDFEFSIPPLISVLQVQFYIRTENTLPIVWGQAQLQISQLDDQVIKQVELTLKDPVGRELGSSIELEAQIVLNKHQYLQTQLQKFEQRIFTIDNDLLEYKHDLETIEKPFKTKMMAKEQNKQLSSNIFTQQLQNTSNLQDQQEVNNEQEQQQNQQVPENKEQLFSVLHSERRLEQFDETPEAPEILQHGVIIFTIYGLITLFVCSAKPSFLDVIVCHGLMITIFMDRFEPFHIKVVGGGLVASIFYDILWIKQYHLWWYSDDSNNPEWGLNAVNLLRFVLIFTYMQFLYKVFSIIISLLFATIYTNFIGNLLTHQKDISLQFGKSNIKLEKVEKLFKFSKLGYKTKQTGEGFDFRIFLQQQEQIKSFWHDIPIYPDKQHQKIINIGIEIPKERIAKYEVSKSIQFNPIVQDTKLNKLTKQQQLRFYAQFATFNYGFIPQTWENSIKGLVQGYKGDDDPLDICELGITKQLFPGDVLEAVVLGAFCVLDQDEVDWKILVLNKEEADQLKINNFSQYESLYPGTGQLLLQRFKLIKTFDGKKSNPILFDDKIFESDQAAQIIHETHEFWNELLTGQTKELKEKREQFNIN